MENIREIGGRLYACGVGGQVYRRSDDGAWDHLDRSLIQPHGLPAADVMLLQRINGPSEDQIYVVGATGLLLFWNGKTFTRLDSGTNAYLIDILVEGEDVIWICGADGTLLRGNHRDGFKAMPGITGGPRLTTMNRFQGKLYLASSASHTCGLFTYEEGRFERVRTGLDPEMEDTHTVDSAAGVLWAVGLKDILRFDGRHWERIDFPGNTLIR